MSLTIKELQAIRGIGPVLAQRLLDAGHDSFAAIAALGEEGLGRIRGVNPRAIPAIIAQAAAMAAPGSATREERLKTLQGSLAGLRQSVQTLTATARDRFADQLDGKAGRKLTAALLRFVTALEKLEGSAGKKLKRTGKGLVKAEKRLEGLADAGLKDVRKGLKRARKALERVQA